MSATVLEHIHICTHLRPGMGMPDVHGLHCSSHQPLPVWPGANGNCSSCTSDVPRFANPALDIGLLDLGLVIFFTGSWLKLDSRTRKLGPGRPAAKVKVCNRGLTLLEFSAFEAFALLWSYGPFPSVQTQTPTLLQDL